MTHLAVLMATVGYVGCVPFGPGTAGSIAALGLFAFVRWVNLPALELGTIAVVLVVGVWSATVTERALGQKDPGRIVIDEVLGMLITLALVPVSMGGVVVGFVLFRVFDILKPFPAARLEGLRGGMGVMLDDAVAGVYAHVTLRALAVVAPAWLVV